MNYLEQLQPLHDRILVIHLPRTGTLEVIRENPGLVDMIGQGDNAQHDDNRRVFRVSRVVSVGESVRGVRKGDTIAHTDWNDLPDWAQTEENKGYAIIREKDVAGHVEAEALGYQA